MTIRTRDEIIRQLEMLQAQAERLTAELPDAVVLPDEPPEDVTVITWQHKFMETGRTYTYAAVRTDTGRWYVSGSATWNRLRAQRVARGTSPRFTPTGAHNGDTWQELMEFIHMRKNFAADQEIWGATEWRGLR